MRILYLPSSLSQQRQFQKKNVHIYPVLLAMQAEFYRKQGHEVLWNDDILECGKIDKVITEPENLPFLSLPHPDRVFTRAKEFTSGNYKYLPGTHILSANGCIHGKCIFCVENGKDYQVRPVEDVISEIGECMKLNFSEVFDDSATFPDGKWCYDFCNQIIFYGNTPYLGCNMRIGADVDFKLMKWAGFRMLLYGVESANQATLNRIQKGVKVEDIIPTIKKASEAGLSPHICVVFGWEWETDKEAFNTLNLVYYLLRKGYAKTAQASFIHCKNIKGNESQRHFVKDIYKVWKYPDFWFHQIKDIKNKDDLKYLWLKIKKGLER